MKLNNEYPEAMKQQFWDGVEKQVCVCIYIYMNIQVLNLKVQHKYQRCQLYSWKLHLEGTSGSPSGRENPQVLWFLSHILVS